MMGFLRAVLAYSVDDEMICDLESREFGSSRA